MAPGFSLAEGTLFISIFGFFSVGESRGGGEDLFREEGRDVGNMEPPKTGVTALEDGFFRPLRDGGGGASSVKPWERN